VLGWTKAFAAAALYGNWGIAVLWLIPCIVYVAALVLAISKAKADYYEDVLETTERSYAALEAAKLGRVKEGAAKTKVGKSGMGKGWGASAFFYKHLTESRRESVIDKGILIGTIAGAFFMLLTKDGSESDMIAALIFTTYMQIFTINMGRWNKELIKPYIYLVPQSNFKKLLAILSESFLKQAVDSVVVMTVIGLILQLNVQQILICIVTRYGFGLVLLGANIFAERVLGGIQSKSLILTLYLIMMMLVAVPGMVLAFVLAEVVPEVGLYGGMLVSVVWNVICAFLMLFFCRNVLQNPEMNQG
ncbi:MAG: hypothetical protein IJC68_02455, partial [Firmicutes bacterium]|nr:hypothetical protein [Bacillota bacterium]